MSIACGPTPTTGISNLPLETGIGFVNFSQRFYVAFRIRAHADDQSTAYFASDLLAPGASQRVRMLDAVGTGCAGSFDVQVFLYQRVDERTPIGLDPGEMVKAFPVAAGQIENVPACDVSQLETYTIVNFDAPLGVARVKFAQDTPIDQAIRDSGRFANVDAAWEVSGVDPLIASQSPPAPAPAAPITGSVTDASGNPFEGVGVLVRTRFRVRVNDSNTGNDPDVGYGEPIDVAVTDANGRFEFDRPAGAYELEFFADGLAFRPAVLELESPSDAVSVIAELLP